MIEKTVWVADDGKVFESDNECFDYEVTKIIAPVQQTLHFFDSNFDPLPLTCVENAWGIHCLTARAAQALDQLCEKYNVITPWPLVDGVAVAGAWVWDDVCGCWIDYSEIRAQREKEWRAMDGEPYSQN